MRDIPQTTLNQVGPSRPLNFRTKPSVLSKLQGLCSWWSCPGRTWAAGVLRLHSLNALPYCAAEDLNPRKSLRYSCTVLTQLCTWQRRDRGSCFACMYSRWMRLRSGVRGGALYAPLPWQLDGGPMKSARRNIASLGDACGRPRNAPAAASGLELRGFKLIGGMRGFSAVATQRAHLPSSCGRGSPVRRRRATNGSKRSIIWQCPSCTTGKGTPWRRSRCCEGCRRWRCACSRPSIRTR
jgi:hypothetical protein